jgi:predicted RNase H-like nuclease
MAGMKFIGIDMAWKPERNPSGFAVLEEGADGAVLTHVSSILGLAQVQAAVAEQVESTVVIAVDAPLVVVNESGSRKCETDLSKAYGANHASCYPSNLTLFKGRPASSLLADWLGTTHGFAHAPAGTGDGKVMMEVYPHAAYIALTDRKHTIKYKKGTVAAKCKGLAEVQTELRSIMSGAVRVQSNPLLDELLARAPGSMKGAARKSFEDELDAVFCAYLAYRYWVLKRESFEIFGDAETGYIANPQRLVAASA